MPSSGELEVLGNKTYSGVLAFKREAFNSLPALILG